MLFSLTFSFTPAGTNAVKAEEEVVLTNFAPNGSFEETIKTNRNVWTNNIEPVGWSEWFPSGKPQATVDQTVYYNGKQSILLESVTTGRAALTTTATITPGKSYRLGIWIKTDQVVSSNGIFLRTQYVDGSGRKVGDGPKTEKLTGTNNWTLREIIFTAPSNAKKLKIEPFFETGTGKAWFDDVVLEEWNGLTGIELDQKAVSLEEGKTFTLTPIFIPANAGDKEEVVWMSSNPDIASVNNGTVIGIKEGNVTITVQTKDGRFSADCVVSVETEETIKAYDQARQKWFDKLTGGTTYDLQDPDVVKALDDLAKSAKEYWDKMDKSAGRTYLWSDLANPANEGQISDAYGRLLSMARAYATKGSSLYHNGELKKDIISGLDWMYDNRYNEHQREFGNWWHWEIGIPQTLNNIVVLMYEDLSAKQLTNYTRTIDRFIPDPTARTLNGVKETGANLLDKAFAVSLRGIIGKNSAKVIQGEKPIGKEFVYVDHGDGVYKDGSLIQHFNIAYTGGYGAVWISRAADMMYLLNGSPWTITDPDVNNVYNWVEDSFEPLIYKGAMMDMVSGRGISRKGSSDHDKGRETILTILRLAEGAPPDKALQIKQMVKYWIMTDHTFDQYHTGLPLYELNLVKTLMNEDSIKPRKELEKNQVFAGMDRVTHLRPGFGLGISMFSDRISAFEYGNGENSKGWYTGIGATYVYNNDLKQFSNDFWPTVDSFRLPGTTSDGSKGILKDWQSYYNPRTWVGGSSIDGLYGAAGMDFSLKQVTGSDLQGKKSWFMFDDEVVALGTGITSTNNRKVETIVENRQLNDTGDNQLIVNGEAKPDKAGWSESMNNVKWAHLTGNVSDSDIGYYFPNAPAIDALREARTGSWKDINSNGSPTPITRNYVSLAFNHGVNPSDGSYSYVLLPNKSVTQTEEYSKNPDVEILMNTSDVQAVKEKKLNITAANFFHAGTVEGIHALNPASVLVKEEGGELALSISDPTQKQKTVTIAINKPGLSLVSNDSTINVVQTEPTIKVEVNVSGSIGKTHVAAFKVVTDIDHLDELVKFANEKGFITNKGIANSLLAKISNVQTHQSDEKQKINGLNSLKNEVEAQSGKHITREFAEYLLENIAYLKGTK
jgi:hyaluronate lyase